MPEPKIEQSGAKEFKELKEPKLSFHFLFSSHAEEKSAEKLEELLAKADVFAPEMFGFDSEDRDAIRKLSNGNLTFEDFTDYFHKKYGQLALERYLADGTFFRKLLKTIENSKKPLMFIDIQQEEIDAAELDNRRDSLSRIHAVILFTKGDFDLSLKELKRAAELMVEGNIRKRELYIRKKFKKRLDGLLEKYPQLRDKNEINVLITFGSGHTTLYQDLKKDIPEASFSREFNVSPYVYSSFHEAARKLLFHKDVSEGLLAKAMAELLIAGTLNSELRVAYLEEAVALARKLVAKLTIHEIEGISKTMGAGASLESALKNVGIALPKTKEEFMAALKN